MGCKEVGHKHNWPTEGTLVIQRCEIRCNFCPGDKGLKPWKYAWFLRRHVRAMHCTPGKGKTPFPNLEVAITWKEKKPNAKKNIRSRKRSIKGEIKDEIKEEDVSSSDAEEEGMAAPGERSVGTGWVDQPTYADVPHQHPGETGKFTTVGPRDVHFDQTFTLGDGDEKDLINAGDDILNYNDIGAFLNAQTDSFVEFIDEKDAPTALNLDNVDIKHESDDGYVHVASAHADLMANRSATYFGLDENGDAISPDHLKVSKADFTGSDKFFMSDYSDGSDFGFDDVPLAAMSTIAHSGNSDRPPANGETSQMINMCEQATKAMLEQGMSSEQMLHTMQQFLKQSTGSSKMQAMGSVMEID